MKETPTVKAVQLKASELGWRLYRNNVGRLQAKTGQWVQYGLCVGSSDLIGWRTRVVTPDMVGQPIAQFVAVEVKTDTGTLTEEQIAFLATVRLAGGVAMMVRSEGELR
jgi:hypothetical protein